MEAPDLTDAEKAAIHYADLAASNHLAISDETAIESAHEPTDFRGLAHTRRLDNCPGSNILSKLSI
jgi:hypothetical protein